MSRKMNSKVYLIFVAIMILTGCASEPNKMLQETRIIYSAADSDAQIVRAAPVQLNKAQEALNLAEFFEKDGAKPVIIEHYAYLTVRHLDIAKELSKILLAEEKIKLAGDTRKEVVYNARLAEADQARSKLNDMYAQMKDLNGKRTERGIVLTLNDIVFDNNSANLRQGSMNNIKRVADFLIEYSKNNVIVGGFTDNIGSAAYNQQLSERRAQTVRQALIRYGVDGRRVTAMGYGESNPVSSNNTAVGQQRNRRVEVVISENSPDTRSPR